MITIIKEDADYIFVNKPSGVLTIPDRHDETLPSVLNYLKNKYERVFIVHRIDRDTSGCLVFAKHETAHRHASILFEKRQVKKQYVGIVHGIPPLQHEVLQNKIMEHPTIKGKMIVNAKLGKEAITAYDVEEEFGNFSYLRYTIHTGRMHQIRIHSANMGCPIVCDPIYGKLEPIFVSQINKKYALAKNDEAERPILSRLALHAAYISFANEAGETLIAEAPLYKDMSATLQQMRKWVRK
jgi:23S rRNA pseudouridine1911/1915/1917 synthase